METKRKTIGWTQRSSDDQTEKEVWTECSHRRFGCVWRFV